MALAEVSSVGFFGRILYRERGMAMRSRWSVIVGIMVAGVTLGVGMATGADSATQPQMVDDVVSIASSGDDLTAAQVAELERTVETDPADVRARTQLIGFYFTRFNSPSAKEGFRRHVLWLIENRPQYPLLGRPYGQLDPTLDPEGYVEARKRWLAHAEAHPRDAVILANAAQFLLLHDMDKAEKLLKQAKAVEPGNPKWGERLAQLYALQAMDRAKPEERRAAAAKALAELEAVAKAEPNELHRSYSLPKLAQHAFDAGDLDKASSYAQEALRIAPRYQRDWNYGNAIHDANAILGRIALRRDDVKAAKEHLRAAGKTPGSPQLNSFGPTMDLAQELLARGEGEAVIGYLEDCGRFWKMERRQLKRWVAEIRGGGTPVLDRYAALRTRP